MPGSTNSAHTILLIENNLKVVAQVSAALAGEAGGAFQVVQVRQLHEGLERLEANLASAVLLDLNLPDSRGIETFERIFAAAPYTPILILGHPDEEAIAVRTVELGAQDYLLPGNLDGYSLPRALRNAIERRVVEDAFYVERERAFVTLNSIGDAVLCTDLSGNVSFLNLVAERMTGWSREEAIGRSLAEVFRVVNDVTRETVLDPLHSAVVKDRTVNLLAGSVLIRRDGVECAIADSAAPIHDRAGCVTGAVIVFQDVSAARSMAHRLAHAAHHDPVTQLPNRLLLNDRISQAITLAHRQRRTFAVMFVDLDHFKAINDSLGHSAGDTLLQSAAERLKTGLRSSDTVSRQGGDEFVVLLPEVISIEDAGRSAERLLLSLRAPHFIDGHRLHITGSIGISIYPQDGGDPETLLHNADIAMYRAKEEGRDTYRFFEAKMNLSAVEHQSLEAGLRRALEGEEFILHYQPKVNLSSGKITGAEALIRWQEPQRGLLEPGDFIPIAEDCGLMIAINRWVLREACRQARSWHDGAHHPLTIAVNVSPVGFLDPGFIGDVRAALAETGLEGRYLQIELTEGALMKDVAATATALRELNDMGVCMAIDDFGTGYSSLSYLRQFHIDVLKIDRSFIRHIVEEPKDALLVNAIIAMGQSLDYLVIAEGIETEEQRTSLRSRHCDEGQGYLFGRPMIPSELLHLF